MTADDSRATLPLHPLLRRQIRRAGLDPESMDSVPGLARLIASISAAYEDADQLRYLNDRAFELSEVEQQALTIELKARIADAARDRARMIAVFDATPTAFLVLTPAAVVLDANAAALTVLLAVDGRPTDLIGQQLSAVITAEPDDVTSRMRLSSLLAAINERTVWANTVRMVLNGTAVSRRVAFRPFDRSVDAAGILSVDAARHPDEGAPES